MKSLLIALTLLLVTTVGAAQNIVGTWTTYDDNTGEARSTVYIWRAKNGKYYGKITDILDASEKNNLCDKCEGDKHNQPVLGMVIITGLEKDDDEFTDGTILDPENGEVYECKLWIDDDGNLKVRGYWGIFYRTQTWKKKG